MTPLHFGNSYKLNYQRNYNPSSSQLLPLSATSVARLIKESEIEELVNERLLSNVRIALPQPKADIFIKNGDTFLLVDKPGKPTAFRYRQLRDEIKPTAPNIAAYMERTNKVINHLQAEGYLQNPQDLKLNYSAYKNPTTKTEYCILRNSSALIEQIEKDCSP